MKGIHTVPANKVREGAFLVGLENGYVIEVEESPSLVDYVGINPFLGMILITFNDACGGENYMILTPEHPVDVRYED